MLPTFLSLRLKCRAASCPKIGIVGVELFLDVFGSQCPCLQRPLLTSTVAGLNDQHQPSVVPGTVLTLPYGRCFRLWHQPVDAASRPLLCKHIALWPAIWGATTCSALICQTTEKQAETQNYNHLASAVHKVAKIYPKLKCFGLSQV